MKYFLATLILMITLPLVAQAEVQINEIAWMGVATTNGQYGEWFELYNSGSESVSLSGWKLYKSGGTKLVYTFSGTINAGGYYVVERTTASVLDPVPGINNESGAFSNSGFSNTGEFLVLKNNEVVVQNIDHSSGWTAGEATNKQTMQYNAGTWITAVATPGTANSTANTTPTISSQENDEDNTTEKNEELYTTEQGTTGGIRTKESREKILPLLVRARKDPHIDFTFPATAYTGNTYDFIGAVTLEYNTPTNGVFVWNMGDGEVVRVTENTPIRYTYRYSGTYTVTLSYYPNDRYGKPVLWASRKIVVADSELTLRTLDNNTIEIKNHAGTVVDLSQWIISTPQGAGAIPEMTLLAPNATIAFSIQAFNIGTAVSVTLSTMNGTLVASTAHATSSGIQNSIAKISRVLSTNKVIQIEPLESTGPSTTEYSPEALPVRQNHTKNIVIGVIVVVMMIGLLFLERFIAHRE